MSNVGDMSCRDWEETLALSHPDDLSPAQWMERQKHIASCPACASILSEYLEMDECIRRRLTPSRPLKLPSDFATERSGTQWDKKREKRVHGQAAPTKLNSAQGSFSALVRDMDCRSFYYYVHLEALCMCQYMEVLPDSLMSAEVLVEVHLGELLLSLFEIVSVEDVSLHFFPSSPRGRQLCSIQVQAHCQGGGETQPQFALKAMELTVEETISSILQELFGVVKVDELNIRCFAQEQDGRENTSFKSA